MLKLTEKSKAAIDAYHAHLDVCAQCEEHPFDQCPEGYRLLVEAGKEMGLSMSAVVDERIFP